MLKRVQNFISQENLFDAGDTVVVGVSGGADSMALLHLLSSTGLSLQLIVAHLNHCLRGDESNRDAAFVEQYANALGLQFESSVTDVANLARTMKTSVEEAGREVRYGFFAEVAQRYGAQRIAVAHHADDQAETVLMMLIRGAGMAGLGGMLPKADRGRIVRPLLCVSRADIEEYLKRNDIPFIVDSTNNDTRYLRNRIRHELLPLLNKYNSRISERLSVTARLLSAEDAAFNEIIDQLVLDNADLEDGNAAINVLLLQQQHIAFRYRIYRYLIEKINGSLRRINHGHICAIDRIVIGSASRATIHLPDNTIVSRSYDSLRIRTGQKTTPPFFFDIEGPGTYPLPFGGNLKVESVDPPYEFTSSSEVAYFDLGRVPFPWRVRTFNHGDRISPFGMTGTKKIKDLFIDSKIPYERRSMVPIVTCCDQVIWVAGIRTGREGAVGGDSSQVARALLSGFELLN